MSEKCIDNPRDCPLLPRIEALEDETGHNKAPHKEFYEKLEDHHTSVNWGGFHNHRKIHQNHRLVGIRSKNFLKFSKIYYIIIVEN